MVGIKVCTFTSIRMYPPFKELHNLHQDKQVGYKCSHCICYPFGKWQPVDVHTEHPPSQKKKEGGVRSGERDGQVIDQPLPVAIWDTLHCAMKMRRRPVLLKQHVIGTLPLQNLLCIVITDFASWNQSTHCHFQHCGWQYSATLVGRTTKLTRNQLSSL
jgi:hypothetical protein